MIILKTAIIDDGISINESLKINNPNIIHLQANGNTICLDEVDENTYVTSHGTVCYWIYTDNINREDYQLYSIKVIDPITRKSSINNLRVALEWCYDNEIKLVCMSIGTTNFLNYTLDDILQKLYKKNVIMIAACSNKNVYTYPASSQYVIGVKHDYQNILSRGRYFYNEQDISNIEIICNGDFDALGKKVNYEFKKYNSFIVPYIASIIHKNLLKNYITNSDIRSVLKRKTIINNELSTYEYYKGSYKDWTENIDIPIIAIVNDNGNSTKYFIENIVYGFRSNEYNAILLQNQTVNKEYYIYFLDKLIKICGNIINVVKLINNASNADILFVDIPLKYLDELMKKNITDIIIRRKGSLLFSGLESIEIAEFNETAEQKVIEQIFNKLK